MSKDKKKKLNLRKKKIVIIGLGYVGLPLAVEFSKKRKVLGFDIDNNRIKNLRNGKDSSLEISKKHLKAATNLKYTNNIKDIKNEKIFIIAVPTPVNKFNKPDLTCLKNASKLVGNILKKNDIVIYESTVYPGVTEEVCANILEQKSGLTYNNDFFCGYSPERANPGDKKHRLKNIKKITSGSTPQIANIVDNLYKDIITAGTYKAPSIKVAEAAKVIENTQRDVNIALVNEFSIIFNKLNIDTKSVLDAALTKWNFLPFKPGLVGGHCIGVDPFYLSHIAKKHDLNPKMILAGRSINDKMGPYIGRQILDLMIEKKISVIKSKVLIMGFTFKENCPDIRNTKVIDLIRKLENSKCKVDVYDPWINKNEAKKIYKIKVVTDLKKAKYDVIVLAVAHEKFKKLKLEKIRKFGKKNHIVYDIKYLFNSNKIDGRL